jgi:arylsulfatase A-like enzyme
MLFACVLTRWGDADELPQRPNFVLVYADDWRWDAIGVVQREQDQQARFPWLNTPRLDRFAGESIRFRESFVVNSLCSPGRACVLTSRYSHLNGIIGNGIPLPVDTLTIATQLKTAGYTNAYCGKWHMDGQRERPGFDYTASFIGQGRYFDCPILFNGQETPTQGWIDDVSTDYAIDFLKGQSKEKPFFLWLGFKSPHGPRGGANLPERARELYVGETSRPAPNVGVRAVYQAELPKQAAEARQNEGNLAYMRHITAIDDCFGRLLDALDATGHAERTVVIVTSDNGYYLGEHGLGDKRSAYDESLRVPLMIRLPGQSTPRGVVNDAMVLNIDHAPTILDLAGAAPLPEAQGLSLRPLLGGEAPPQWRDSFLYEYFKEGNFAAPTVLAVRTKTHKLITYPGHEEWTELFDLQNDPYETNNLAGEAALMANLRREFDEQLQAVAFRMPEGISASGEPARKPAKKKRKSAD